MDERDEEVVGHFDHHPDLTKHRPLEHDGQETEKDEKPDLREPRDDLPGHADRVAAVPARERRLGDDGGGDAVVVAEDVVEVDEVAAELGDGHDAADAVAHADYGGAQGRVVAPRFFH